MILMNKLRVCDVSREQLWAVCFRGIKMVPDYLQRLSTAQQAITLYIDVSQSAMRGGN